MFAAWEISPALAARAEERARGEGAPIRYQIQVERRAREGDPARPIATVNLPDALGGESWYVDLPDAGGFVRALLGLDLPGGFVPLLTSRWAALPPEGPCGEEGSWEIALNPDDAAWLEAQSARARSLGGEHRADARYHTAPPKPKP